MFCSQQFKLCYCPVVMKNVILEFECHNTKKGKCLDEGCRPEEECPFIQKRGKKKEEGGP